MANKIQVGEAILPVGVDLSELKKGLNEGSQEVKGFFGKMQGAADVFSGTLARDLVKAVGQFVSNTIQDFAKLDRAIKVTAGNLERMGWEFKAAQKAVGDYADEIESMTRFSDTEAIDSLNNLLTLTGNLKDATDLNSIAMDLAVAKNMSLAEAAQMVGLAFQGNDRGISQLARTMGLAGDAAKDAGFVFEEMARKFKDARISDDDTLTRWAKFTAAVGNLGEMVAEKVNPHLNALLDRLTKITSAVAAGIKGAPAGPGAGSAMGISDSDMDNQDAKRGRQGGKVRTPAQIAKENQDKLKAAERAEKQRKKAADDAKKDAEELKQKQDAYNAAVEKNRAMFAGPVAATMQDFFTQVLNGTASLQGAWEALGKAIAKSMLNAIAQVLEQEAAKDLVTAIAASTNFVTAASAGGFYASAALKAAGAGAIRAVAASLAEGGIVSPAPGGRIVQVAEAGEAEVVSPLSKLKDLIGGARAGVTITGGVTVALPSVRDASGFRSPRAAREFIENLEAANRRMGIRGARG